MRGADGRGMALRALRPAFALVTLLVLLGAPVRPAQAQGHRAALVIDYGNGQVENYCVPFGEDSITGLELLQRAKLTINLDQFGGLGAAVCKIGGTGCATPSQSCFCECQGTPCARWSYFHGADSGGWRASNVGATSYAVRDGAVEGWTWSDNAKPPALTFAAICAVAAPDTPTAAPVVPTATRIPPSKTPRPPTVTPVPPTRAPTRTPMPPTATEVPPTEPPAPAMTATPVPPPAATPTAAEPSRTATQAPSDTPTAAPTATPTTPSTATLPPTATTAPTAQPSATPVILAIATPTTQARGGFAGLSVPDDQRMAQRIGVFAGLLIGMAGLLLWVRLRMARLPAASTTEPQQPKMFYKINGKTTGAPAAPPAAEGEDRDGV